MRLFLKILFTAIVAIACSGTAFASETRVVPANRASAILFYYTAANDTCYAGGKPDVHITHKPEHGGVSTAWKAFKMGKESGHCAGKPMHGTLVIYRPAAGFHGTDKVAVRFTGGMSGGYFLREKEFIVNIVVK
jgi:hypothetical protein